MIVGTGLGPHIDAVARALSVGPHAPVDVVGFVSQRPHPDNGLRSLGTLEELGRVIAEHRIDEVIIADSDFPERRAVELSTSATSGACGCGSRRRRWRS